MDEPTRTRTKRSRSGLLLVALALLLGAWEIAGRVMPAVPVTPLGFVRAALAVAAGGSPPAALDDEFLAKMAYRPLPYVMWGLKPGWAREVKADGIVRTSNSLGFRGREIEQPKPAGRYRIVCLGGSTTYSDAVGDADTYPLFLEQFLREARPDLDLEVVNAGVPNYTTYESLCNLAFRCLELQPDMIVVYHAVNDYRTVLYRNHVPTNDHYRKVWDGSAHGYKAGASGTELAQGLAPFVQHLPPENNGDQRENAVRNGSGAYRRNLASMAGIARAHGIRPVFVGFVSDEVSESGSYPGAEKVAADILAGVIDFNAAMQQVAREQDVLYIDLRTGFPQGQGCFHDPVHMTAKGTRLKAQAIARGLLPALP